MRKSIILLSACITACADSTELPNEVGRLQNNAIREASGLARSNRDAQLLWIVNDGGGGPMLYATGVDGSDKGVFRIDGIRNLDWEDMASFILDGRPMLLIADIGDNLGQRESLHLFVIEEPGPELNASTLDVAWQIELRYPSGSIDAESVSVDTRTGEIFILSKREVPAVLYSVPLRSHDAGAGTVVMATRIGTVESLPQPSRRDRDRALARLDWHWQPTAMDISPDGAAMALLTYRGLYLYWRDDQQSWIDALQEAPLVIPTAGVRDAESVAFSADGGALYVTTEHTQAPLLRFDLTAR